MESGNSIFAVYGGLQPRETANPDIWYDRTVPAKWVNTLAPLLIKQKQAKERVSCSLGIREGEQMLVRMCPSDRRFTDDTLANWLVTFIYKKKKKFFFTLLNYSVAAQA